jgi:hypothetical protein
VRTSVAVCLAVAALAGCGGTDDRPDLAASPPTTETTPTEPAPTTTQEPAAADASANVGRSGVPTPERAKIAEQAAAAGDAIGRWDDSLAACIGPEGRSDDAGATCTHAAWDQLFDQMYAVQYELLALMNRMPHGPCRRELAPALDGVHGFLSGATPLEVVWLDDQQRPPSLFDLRAIVDVARPAPARMREAAATTCRA